MKTRIGFIFALLCMASLASARDEYDNFAAEFSDIQASVDSPTKKGDPAEEIRLISTALGKLKSLRFKVEQSLRHDDQGSLDASFFLDQIRRCDQGQPMDSIMGCLRKASRSIGEKYCALPAEGRSAVQSTFQRIAAGMPGDFNADLEECSQAPTSDPRRHNKLLIDDINHYATAILKPRLANLMNSLY